MVVSDINLTQIILGKMNAYRLSQFEESLMKSWE